MAGRESVLLASATSPSAVHLVAHACQVDLSDGFASLFASVAFVRDQAESVCLSEKQIVASDARFCPLLFRFSPFLTFAPP